MNLAKKHNLLRLWLKRRKNHSNYIHFQIARAGLIQKEISKFIKNPKNLKLLDIGSHRGGYSIAFAKQGYKVTGLEISKERIDTAKKASLLYNTKIEFVLADARYTPFKDNEFDVIILSNVIEHIQNTKKLLKEIHRILKPKGILYIQFPPYYGIFGAHIYFKSVSLPIHYFPKKITKFLIKTLRLESELDEIEKITIDSLIKLSKSLGFKVKSLKSVPEGMEKLGKIKELSPFYKLILEK